MEWTVGHSSSLKLCLQLGSELPSRRKVRLSLHLRAPEFKEYVLKIQFSEPAHCDVTELNPSWIPSVGQ